MADFGVVLDTNVLYGMPVADTLLLASYFNLYKFYWSADIHQLRYNAASRR